jgi:hypothetical protein
MHLNTVRIRDPSEEYITAFEIAIYPCARNGQHYHRLVERWQSAEILSPWHLSSVGTGQRNHYGRNKVKVALEVVMKYMMLERSDTWTAEILKIENAYANASADANEYDWNVDLACHLAYMRDARSRRQVDSRRDKHHFAATIRLESVLNGTEALASVLRTFDNIRAWSDGATRRTQSSEEKWMVLVSKFAC